MLVFTSTTVVHVLVLIATVCADSSTPRRYDTQRSVLRLVEYGSYTVHVVVLLDTPTTTQHTHAAAVVQC